MLNWLCLWPELFVQAMTSTPVTDITKPVFFVWFTPHLLYWVAQIPFTVKVRARQQVGKTVHSQWGTNEKSDQQCCYRKSTVLEKEAYSIHATVPYVFTLQLFISTSHFEDRCSESSQVFMWITPEDPKSKLWWYTATGGEQEKPVLRCLRGGDVAPHMRGLQQSVPAWIQTDLRPDRFYCLALPSKDCCSKPAAKSDTPVISPFLLALCFQMVKEHFLCSHTWQQTITLLIFHIMSIINQIHYTLWSIPVIYWISLLSRCSVGNTWTTSLKITNKKMQLKATFHSRRERGLHSIIPVLQTISLINLKCYFLLQVDFKTGGISFHKTKSLCPAHKGYTY